MTMYETIKAAISVKQAAEHYGLKASCNGMACCPFHNDRHPSLKLNEDYFFCFGCGAKGDVIDLVARLFDLSGYEAAQKLAADFGISTEPGQAVRASYKPKRPHIRQFREDEMLCSRVLTDYLHILEDWKLQYAPKTPDDEWDDRFVEACQRSPQRPHSPSGEPSENPRHFAASMDESVIVGYYTLKKCRSPALPLSVNLKERT